MPRSVLVLLFSLSVHLQAAGLQAEAPPFTRGRVGGHARPETERPNILLILVDDLGWGDPSCYGGAGVPTPSMDRLVREGTRFTQFYVSSPICSASRCGLMTGKFPARSRITSYLQTRAGNRQCEQADFLDPKAPSFVRAFKEAGYATVHVGKWHLGGGRDVTDAPKFAAYGYDLGLGTYESRKPQARRASAHFPIRANPAPSRRTLPCVTATGNCSSTPMAPAQNSTTWPPTRTKRRTWLAKSPQWFNASARPPSRGATKWPPSCPHRTRTPT